MAAPGEEGVVVHQDVRVYDSRLEAGKKIEFAPVTGRTFWIQLTSGRITVNGREAGAGDAVYGDAAEPLKIQAAETAHFLLFDLGRG